MKKKKAEIKEYVVRNGVRYPLYLWERIQTEGAANGRKFTAEVLFQLNRVYGFIK